MWPKDGATDKITKYIREHKHDSGVTHRVRVVTSSRAVMTLVRAGIVYCLSRKDCEVMAEKLNKVRFRCFGHPPSQACLRSCRSLALAK